MDEFQLMKIRAEVLSYLNEGFKVLSQDVFPLNLDIDTSFTVCLNGETYTNLFKHHCNVSLQNLERINDLCAQVNGSISLIYRKATSTLRNIISFYSDEDIRIQKLFPDLCRLRYNIKICSKSSENVYDTLKNDIIDIIETSSSRDEEYNSEELQALQQLEDLICHDISFIRYRNLALRLRKKSQYHVSIYSSSGELLREVVRGRRFTL